MGRSTGILLDGRSSSRGLKEKLHEHQLPAFSRGDDSTINSNSVVSA